MASRVGPAVMSAIFFATMYLTVHPIVAAGKTTDELCAGAFRGRVQSDEFIELANLTLGGDGAQEVAELEYKAANEKGSAKLLGEQSI